MTEGGAGMTERRGNDRRECGNDRERRGNDRRVRWVR